MEVDSSNTWFFFLRLNSVSPCCHVSFIQWLKIIRSIKHPNVQFSSRPLLHVDCNDFPRFKFKYGEIKLIFVSIHCGPLWPLWPSLRYPIWKPLLVLVLEHILRMTFKYILNHDGLMLINLNFNVINQKLSLGSISTTAVPYGSPSMVFELLSRLLK